MKFSIQDFFSKCKQIRRKLRIWSHLLKKFLMENFIFCAVEGENKCYVKLCILKSFQKLYKTTNESISCNVPDFFYSKSTQRAL